MGGPVTHTRAESEAKGQVGRELLADLLPPGTTLFEPQWDVDVYGLDYIVRTPKSRYSAELKTDFRAHETGNAFIEVISDDNYDSPGWAYTSIAQFLFYLLVGTKELIIVPMHNIRRYVDIWRRRYPHARGVNAAYSSVGALVPLVELRRLGLRGWP